MNEIRGEYWIQDGNVDFADGDIGDRNHESIAVDHVVYQHVDQIISLAEELGIEIDGHHNNIDSSEVLQQIISELEERNMNEKQAHAYIQQFLDCDNEAYQILLGGGDGRMYVMKKEGWIAVRSDNIELYGYDEEKRKNLVSGIHEILDSEGIDEEVPPEEIEFSLYDHKTKRSMNVTLQDIETPTLRPQQPILTTKKVSVKDTEENKGQNPTSVKNAWTSAAQNAGLIGPGQDLWRGTSENFSFSKWLYDHNLL